MQVVQKVNQSGYCHGRKEVLNNRIKPNSILIINTDGINKFDISAIVLRLGISFFHPPAFRPFLFD